MGKFIDLTGQKIGRLTVLKQISKPPDKKQDGIYWLCQCECGNFCNRFHGDIKKAQRKKQDCKCKECYTENLVGQKFNRLTVLKRADNYISPTGQVQSAWECLCDCQLKLPENERKTHPVRGFALRSGYIKSCGCIQNYKNEYDLSGEYGIGYTTNFDQYGRNEFYFDKEDYEKIKDYCWHFNKEDGYLYANDGTFTEGYTTVKIHRIILDLTQEDIDLVGDHIHGKETRNDNRKSNLRIATYSENRMNSQIAKNNTSGIIGIGYYDGVWFSRIGLNGKSILLGKFTNKEDAIKARKKAEEKYFGEWSYDNSQAM